MKFQKSLLAVATMLALPITAYAQLEEVVVTATKRSETLQDVSMAITAISGDAITRAGAVNFTDLATTVPSLSLRSAGPGRTKLNIRGVSAATGFAPTVSFYLDEMPIQTISSGSSTSFQQTVIDPKLYDLERIEVLRGPQGTLYGSSSMGGTVRLITAKPLVGENEGSANIDVSDTKEGGVNFRANAMGNLAVGDNGALRLVGSTTENQGYMDRIDRATGEAFDKGVNNETSNTVRATYRQEFDTAYIQPSIYYQKTEMDGKPNYDGPNSEFQQIRRFDAPEPYDDEFLLGNLTYGQSFSGFDVLASLSYLDREFENVEDITDAHDNIFSGDNGLVTEAVFADENATLEDTTLEVRINSNDNERLHWVVGAFYKDSEADAGYRMQRGFPADINPNGLANTQDKRTYEELAGFGELTFDITQTFSVTAGARYLDYEITQFKEDWGWAFTGGDRSTANIINQNVSDDELHGRLTATWQFQEQSQMYGTVSNSTRPGGFNRTVPRSEDPAESVAFACNNDLNNLGVTDSTDAFESDEVVNYEFGWKAQLNDSLRLNTAFYLIEWEDIQQKITLSGDCGVDLTTNLGEAESKGAEVELLALIAENLTLSISGSYTDAELKEDVPTAGVSAGDRLPDVPEFSANINLDYVIPVDTGEFFVVANWNYVDETLEFVGQADDDVTGFGVISGNSKPQYDIIDLRVGFSSEDDWEWLLYVDNLTDEEAIYSYSDALAFNIESYDRTVRNRPRTIGTSFTFKF
ncbi:MAG: TonB-dependent receptor [Gammaproteobacteria bacterium]|jgi:outer membrane receptor protein involved in Fe transport|nr:TonB-dependent receptor [Gammaproteobacteria bacterium]